MGHKYRSEYHSDREKLLVLERVGSVVVVVVVPETLRSHADTLAIVLPDENLGNLYTESGQTLQGSFSSVSKPIFASIY